MLKSTGIRSLAIACACAGLWIASTQQDPPPDLTVTKIADDLHVIVGSGGNVGVYTTDEGVILVDDKFEYNYAQIMQKVKGITSKPIRYLLNTHLHGDHTGGNAKMLAGGVEIVAHENAQRLMEERNMPGVPRLSFHSKFNVRLGGKYVRAHHFGRSHTGTDAVIYFPAHKVIHMGDMFVEGAPFIDYASGGSGVAWTRTLDRVLDLDFETVIPGHGPIMKRGDLLRWKQSFETLKLQLSEMRKSGKSADAAKTMAKLESLPGWAPGSRWDRSFPGLWDELGK